MVHAAFDDLIAVIDGNGFEVTLIATVRRKDGSRVFKIEAHGEHEVEGEG